MKKSVIVFVALALLAVPAVGSAFPPRPGAYLSGFLGVAFPVDMDVTATQFGPGARTFNDRVEFDPGINVGGAGGFDFGYLRIEGELSYKGAEMTSIVEKNSQTRYANVNGRAGAFAMMGNAFLDLRNPSPVTPYIGGGVGIANVRLTNTDGTDTRTGVRTRLYDSDDDTVFAYQAGAGLEISFTRMISLDIGYRYFGTAKAKFNRHASTEAELKFESHNVAAGVRFKF